ncbi:CCR4-NOT transcription complex subunit 2 isoform X3 [Hypomesus transpacificus]|uniref:CCR4-NOT transcription complex subunit 2 isoform X3 n=1 Tax=Hypomesus transpacificus TaxID=137520 RepID=UPI001F082EC9|nr:CCR4-NOT transcription complex subunit 2 isoform X3 [Hypomesus transpacificus]
MYGGTLKKFVEIVEVVDTDFPDESMYYSQPSMFPHRSDKDMLSSPSSSSSGQLSHLGASLYGPQSALGFSIRGLGNNTPQLPRSLTQSTQLQSHIPPTTGGPTMSLHTPPSPSRGSLPMNTRNMLNHGQVGQSIALSGQVGQSISLSSQVGQNISLSGQVGQSIALTGRSSSMGSSGLGSPSRCSPSIICMPKQQPARQPFTINSMSGFGMNRNQAFGMNNIFNGTDGSENVTGLDLSDFPALADRSRREGGGNPTPLLNPLAGRAPYVGMVTKPSNDQNQDFSIHNEDFPALPGANHKDPALGGEEGKANLNSTGRVTNIPSGMVTDQFGMIGLLTFIRAAETDPGMVHLALGSDLTTLGLNLNSPENLYPKFASPWASAPCRPQDIDFHVPSEYLTNIHIRDKLAAIKLARYGEDLLFYLYYMNGGDLLQLLAAVELFNRDWRYHKEERVWITRAPGMEPSLKTNAYERGTYYFFDCLNWRKVAKVKEFHLEYDKLEERPHVPSTFNYNPAQQAF